MEYSIEEWVASATQDRLVFRQAIHTTLLAISNSAYLQPKMIMKGGMLLGIRYKSSRFTEDIDFSTSDKLADIDPEEFEEEMNEALKVSSDALPYRVVCQIQTFKVQPKKAPEGATFPSYNLKIGYASLDNLRAMKRYDSKNSPNTIKIDYSFNEMTYQPDELVLENDESISVYGFHDLIAEKYRSIIQQKIRNRSRRQDIFDIHYLLTNTDDITSEEKMNILITIFNKSKGRLDIHLVNQNSLDDEETIARSKDNYDSLKEEVEGELPVFDDAYTLVNDFYKSLPWNCLSEAQVHGD